ncbi:hypothetical protein [Catenibacterium sp.]|uniref:hypothetical protein n=1 Tax=Catenibacterium sp. TaxID=2049022 RepID=UPI004024FD17
MKTEFVKVEIDRYEDLVIAEEQLRTLKNIIFSNLKYSPIVERLTVDEDKAIIAYLSSICAFDLNELLLDEKAKLENEKTKLEEKSEE